jgi:hypothetical protein
MKRSFLGAFLLAAVFGASSVGAQPKSVACKSDADCAKILTEACSKWVCGTLNVDGNGICQETTTYPVDSDAYECCKAGIDENADPEKWKCCLDNQGTLPLDGCVPPKGGCSEDKDCDDNNDCTDDHCVRTYPLDKKVYVKYGKCSNTPNKRCPETCPTCPDCKPPTVDCSVIADPTLKDCCVAKGGFLWFVMDSCIHNSSDCNIIANIGGDVNGQLNICCNVLNNTGTISGSTISQSCNNTGGGPGGATTGSGTGTPTTPASLGTCEVKCKEVDCSIAVNTGGQGVAWSVTYSPPPDVGAVASAVLRQTSGDVPLTPEEPAPDGSALSIKTISDPSALPPFTVFTKKPESLVGDYLPKFTVSVQLKDVADNDLATLTCGNETALEAKGGASGCGCFLGASPLEFGANAFFLLTLFGGLPALARRLRKRP